MGPAIFKKQVGETLYSIRCIPIGGYCAMEGEDSDTDNPRSFQKAAWWKRLIILVAGSGMNFITGILLMAIVFAPAQQFIVPVIDKVDEGCTIVGEGKLQLGDRILEVDGEKVYVATDFSVILQLNPGDVHDLVVERNGTEVVINDLTMEKHLFPGEETERFGFSFGIEDATAESRLEYAWLSTVNTVRNVRMSLQMLFTGKAGFSDLTGPVGLVGQMAEVAESSETWVDALLNMLYFGAFLAVNLGVMNLLPIPALDGGRVAGLLITTAVEAVTHKKLDPKYEGYVHGAAMVLLLLLMAVILFKDIFTIFAG
jgi:regulator of sigma E protease